jgi:hypothetical protein
MHIGAAVLTTLWSTLPSSPGSSSAATMTTRARAPKVIEPVMRSIGSRPLVPFEKWVTPNSAALTALDRRTNHSPGSTDAADLPRIGSA